MTSSSSSLAASQENTSSNSDGQRRPPAFLYYLGLLIWIAYFTVYAIVSISMCLIYAIVIPLVQPRQKIVQAEKQNLLKTQESLKGQVDEMKSVAREAMDATSTAANSDIPTKIVEEASFPNPTSFWVVLLLLPTNLFSKLWGKIESIPLPHFLRRPLFELWAYCTGCQLHEMKKQIDEYTCLDDFFTRELREEYRPISKVDLVSPCDAKVLSFGELNGDKLRHVKGYEYPLATFMGRKVFSVQHDARSQKYLNHVVFYLSPGDCHRYVSPTTWTAEHRTHFPGALYTVAPMMLKYISGLFSINERVILSGHWNPDEGTMKNERESDSPSTASSKSQSTDARNRFVMALVGAMNVGTIELNFDDVRTNTSKLLPDMNRYDKTYEQPVEMEKGEEVGMFHLGSTIVLLFETDEPFQFSKEIKVGEKVKYGQALRASNNNA